MVSRISTKITVFGMGYVGIPCAALLADVSDFYVTGVQRRSQRSGWKIDQINSGKSPFKGEEPGLDELIERVVKNKKFSVTDDPAICSDADFILIDVQTPTDDIHYPRYESLEEVSRQISKYMKKGVTVIVESTVAPGTTENVVLPILKEGSGFTPDKDFSLAFSYERVMPGKLLEYIINMPRVIGGINEKSVQKAEWLYGHIVKREISTMSSCIAAELAKTIENSYRDVNIAFANEMALVCESMGVNIYDIINVINARHDRHMHIPGAGVGGHCLPKDPWLLRYGAMKYGTHFREPEIIALSRRINDNMPVHLVELIGNIFSKMNLAFRDSKITVMGIAYLEDSDDTRNTPARRVLSLLRSRNTEVILHDPFVDYLDGEKVESDLWKAIDDSDCLVFVTKHSEYYNLDLEKVKTKMKTPIIIDGRNIFISDEMRILGFTYEAIGKG